eukprot:SAG31_NODE_2462_length_5654_cov_465.384740_5_plen_101_part_00
MSRYDSLVIFRPKFTAVPLWYEFCLKNLFAFLRLHFEKIPSPLLSQPEPELIGLDEPVVNADGHDAPAYCTKFSTTKIIKEFSTLCLPLPPLIFVFAMPI